MTLPNKSGLKPLGRAVMLKPYKAAIESSLIAIPDSVLANHAIADQRAVVIEVGVSCWPDEPPRAQAGDKVMVARYAGTLVVGPLDGEQYRMVNDRDIFAAITAEE